MIKYTRVNSARYLAHLDMQRAFARAFRRSGLPIAFSEGFNPHIVMSFASPLSVGYETLGDYLEVKLTEEVAPDIIRKALELVMPEDISVAFAAKIRDDEKKLMSLNSSAEYELTFGFDVEARTGEFKSMETAVVCDRKGREIDVVPYVLACRAEKNRMYLRLKNSSEASLNPAAVVKLLFGDDADVLIRRLECYADIDGKDVPFSSMGEVNAGSGSVSV